MGQLNSKEGIPLKQTEANLHWVLQQNMQWSERSNSAALLLGKGNARFHSDSTQTLDEQTRLALAEVDRLMDPTLASTAPKGSSSTPSLLHHDNNNSSSYGSGSNTDPFDCERPISLPLSHPAHQFMASQFFGAAATKDIVLAATSNPKTAGSMMQRGGQASEEQLTEWTRGRLERVHTSSRLDLQGGNFGSTIGASNSAASSGNNSAANSPAGQSRTLAALNANIAAAENSSMSMPASLASQSQPLNRDAVISLPPDFASSGANKTLGATMTGAGVGAAAQNERIELVTKYLFISALLEKMIASAQTSFQLSLQLESLRKRLKPKRTRDLSPHQIGELQAQSEEKRILLRDNRELFDKSRLTLQWFYADYNLCHALHILHDTESVTRTQREEALDASKRNVDPESERRAQMQWEQERTNPNMLGKTYLLRTGREDVQRLDLVLDQIEHRRAQIEQRLQANERTALSIAHYYLSRHSAGAGLAQSDAPELPATYFQQLDSNGSGRVSREQLQAGLCRLAENLDSLNARIRALEMHNESMADGASATSASLGAAAPSGQSSNMQARNSMQIEKLKQDQSATAQTLRAISNYFLNVFVSNVFVNIVFEGGANADMRNAVHSLQDLPVMHQQHIGRTGLLHDLASAEKARSVVVNPLDVANEGRVGPDENVSSVVGTGLAPEKEAHAIDTPAKSAIKSAAACPAPKSPARTGQTLAQRLETFKQIEAANLALGPQQSPSSVHTEASIVPAPVVEERERRPSVDRSNTDLSLLSRSRKPLPTPPSSRAVSLPLVASNAALAPAVKDTELRAAAGHLEHIGSNQVKPSMYGGQHDRSVAPAVLGEAPTEGALPVNAALAPKIDQRVLASGADHLAHVPLREENFTEFGGITMHPEEHAALVAASAAPAPAPVAQVAPAAAALPLQSAPQWSEPHSLKEGVQEVLHPEVAHEADVIVVAAPSVQLQEVVVAEAPPTRINGALAEVVTDKDLRYEKRALEHVKPAELIPGEHGSVHAANADIAPSSAALKAHAAELHHVKAPVVAPVHTVAPSQISARVASNVALAEAIQPSELKAGKKALDTVEGVQPSSFGGVHDQGALTGVAVDREALQYVKANELHHVRVKEQPGGSVHMPGVEVDTTRVPEQAYSAAKLGANNANLAEVIQPAELKAQKKELDAVTHVQPSDAGGIHEQGARTGVAVDRTALQYVKAHELNHVPLESAAVTATGGIHLIGKPDEKVIPSQVSASVPSNAAVAALAIDDAALRYEKRALEHVPLELQRPTASGGVHMNDTSATVHLSLMDRFKSALGLETAADHVEPAPGLGRVVEKVPVEIVAHTETLPVAAPAEEPFPAQPAAALASIEPHNSALAPLVTVAALEAEAAALTAPVSANKSLAPLVSTAALKAEQARLHHVPIERIEMRSEIAAGVGQVTTRRATPRSQLRGSIAGGQAQPAQSFDFASTASASSAPASAAPSPRQQARLLPTVAQGRSSASSSPRGSIVAVVPSSNPAVVSREFFAGPAAAPAEPEVLSAVPFVASGNADVKGLPVEDALTKELWTDDSASASQQRAGDIKSLEQNVAIEPAPRPVEQTMQM